MGESTNSSPQYDTAQAVAFLQAMHPQGPWHLVAITQTGRPTGATFTTDQVDTMVRWINDRQGKANLYFHVNELAPGFADRKAKKTDVHRVTHLHVDIDDADPAVIERLRAFDPPPTAIVFSGGGYHGYWELIEPSVELDRGERANAALAAALGGDDCQNIDRIMRLPGTLNLPNAKKLAKGREVAKAEVIPGLTDWSRRYGIDDIPVAEIDLGRAAAATGPVAIIELDALPNAVNEFTRSLVQDGDDLERPIGSEGAHYRSRSEALFRVVTDLVRAGVSDEVIVGTILNPRHGISVSVLEKRDPAAYARRQVVSAKKAAESAEPIELGRPGRKAPPKVSEIGLAIAAQTGTELFRNQVGEAYISIAQPGGGELTFAVGSSATRQWLRRQFFESEARPINSQGLAEVIDTWEAQALVRPAQRTHGRIGGVDQKVVIDLGDDAGRAVEISTDGWRVVDRSPIKFIRPAGFKTLPDPLPDGDLNELKSLLGLDDRGWVRVLAFIINCYRPRGPYMPLLVSADQSTGKSVLSDFIKRVIDPNEISKLSLPRTEHDLMIQASQHALLVFDNVSHLRPEMSDLFCRLATGGGMIVRKLYTDKDVSVFNEHRAFLLNGIGSFADRPDLMERAIHLQLDRIPDGLRRTEKEMNRQFEAMLPRLLGRIFDIVAHALARVDATATPTSVRMADSAQWLIAAEPATGLEPGALLKALKEGQDEMMTERAGNDPLLLAIRAFLAGKSGRAFEGTVGELHAALANHLELNTLRDRNFPRSPLTLSNALHQLRPAAMTIGIEIEFLEKGKKGRRVKVSIVGEADAPSPSFPRLNG